MYDDWERPRYTLSIRKDTVRGFIALAVIAGLIWLSFYKRAPSASEKECQTDASAVFEQHAQLKVFLELQDFKRYIFFNPQVGLESTVPGMRKFYEDMLLNCDRSRALATLKRLEEPGGSNWEGRTNYQKLRQHALKQCCARDFWDNATCPPDLWYLTDPPGPRPTDTCLIGNRATEVINAWINQVEGELAFCPALQTYIVKDLRKTTADNHWLHCY